MRLRRAEPHDFAVDVVGAVVGAGVDVDVDVDGDALDEEEEE